jgi:hypothetical protein
MGDPVMVMALFASEEAARHAALHAVEEKDHAVRAQVLAQGWAVWRRQHGREVDTGAQWTVLFETTTPRDEALRNALFNEGVQLTDIVAFALHSLDHRYTTWIDGGPARERPPWAQ